MNRFSFILLFVGVFLLKGCFCCGETPRYIQLYNGSDEAIIKLYIRVSGDEDWKIHSKHPIEPKSYYNNIKVEKCDQSYDIRALYINGIEAYEYDIFVDCSANQKLTFSLNSPRQDGSQVIYPETQVQHYTWFNPSRKLCEENSGKVYSEDICSAAWGNAKEICSMLDGRLPSLDELKQVVSDCGGKINDYENNKENSTYQSCYLQQGFASYYYWSSDDNGNYIPFIDFFYGREGENHDSKSRYVRCMRTVQ